MYGSSLARGIQTHTVNQRLLRKAWTEGYQDQQARLTLLNQVQTIKAAQRTTMAILPTHSTGYEGNCVADLQQLPYFHPLLA
jgi:hypothetical protein